MDLLTRGKGKVLGRVPRLTKVGRVNDRVNHIIHHKIMPLGWQKVSIGFRAYD